MRRLALAALLACPLLALPVQAAPPVPMAAVRPGVALRFPADHGAHPDFRTEWWYLTGWLDDGSGKPLGFQITFFRYRLAAQPGNPSRFALNQLLFAHAALADPALGRLRHGQRIARAGFGLADARVGDMAVSIDDWQLWRGRDGRLHARLPGRDMAFNLDFRPTQPLLLQGQGGYSQKGPSRAEASHYYSWPHLAVSGRVASAGRWRAVTGKAWLDREWSSTLLNPKAVGWDWLGLNLDDGGALTLFRVRDARGGDVWAGGSHRDARGHVRVLGPGDVRWQAGGWWQSPRSGTRWPVRPAVSWRGAGGWRAVPVAPLLPDQELDSRAGGGPLYWEGAVTVPGGRGYLEMTGYGQALKL